MHKTKTTARNITVVLLVFFCSQIHAQSILQGSLNSSLYSWETDQSEKSLDFYQSVSLKLTPFKQQNFYVKTYFRVTNRGVNKNWHNKLYNGYLNYQDTGNRFSLRLGRQFIYAGVIRGSVDGLMLNYNPTGKFVLKALLGAAVPSNHSAKIQNISDNQLAGGYASYRFSGQFNTRLSYFHRQNAGKISWQQLGIGFNGQLIQPLYYQAQFEYDLKNSEVQRLRLRMNYLRGSWDFFSEISQAKPRIYEESFFTQFKMDGYNQWRLGVHYQLNKYQFGVQYLITAYEGSETSQQFIGSVASNWGSIGFLYQDGNAGKNKGIFGELHYEILHGLNLFARSSYYAYQRHLIIINEEATAFAAGANYQIMQQLNIRTEVQQSINSYFNNDWRGLFRLRYTFGY